MLMIIFLSRLIFILSQIIQVQNGYHRDQTISVSPPPSIDEDLQRLLELKSISDGQRVIFDVKFEFSEHGFGIERYSDLYLARFASLSIDS